MRKPVGKVSHYFGHLGVAVLDLTDVLKTGDQIEIVNAEGKIALMQVVSSMQIEKQATAEAQPGQSIGLKVGAKVHPGNIAYKLTD